MSIQELVAEQNLETIWNADNYAYLVFTDHIQLTKADQIDQTESEEKLLELRIFNSEFEARWKRTALGKKWFIRIKDDKNAEDKLDVIDYSYYLDIDFSSCKDGSFTTTGGNKRYTLPTDLSTREIVNGSANKKRTIVDNKLFIRCYVEYYSETGQAYIADWRMMGLEVK